MGEGGTDVRASIGDEVKPTEGRCDCRGTDPVCLYKEAS
jgi:hypothetical protein